MTTPVKAQRNRYLAKVVDELPGHRAALDVAAQAQQMLEEMRAPRPVPESNHPLRTGIVTDEWIDASLAHTAAVTMLEQRRGILLELKRDAAAAAASIYRTNLNSMLAALHTELTRLLDETARVANQLDGAFTPEQAIENDCSAAWKQLTEQANEYAQLRDAQRGLMTQAPADVSVSARRSDGSGEDHCSDLYLRNLDDLWPDWRNPNHTKVIRIDGSQDRLEPWPEDPTQLLLWLVASPARPWIPTLPQLDELRAQRTAKANPLPTIVPGIRKPINTTARVI